MKYSLRKSFSFRRRGRETLGDDHISSKFDANANSTSNSNLVLTKKSIKFLSSSQSENKNQQTKLFEPRSDIHSNDEDDEPFPSITNSTQRPFDRFTSQIRRSLRNTLHRPRPRLASTNSNKHLIFNPNDDNQTQVPTLYPNISTGLSCPMTESTETNQLKPSTKRRKAPLPPTYVNQSVEIDQNHQQSTRKRFSFLRKKHVDKSSTDDQTNQPLTLTQRFHSLRRSFRFGNRNSSSYKAQHSLLSNE